MFNDGSPLRQALESQEQESSKVSLSLDNLEHHKFIVCLTYNIARWMELAEKLSLEKAVVERIEVDHAESCSEKAYQALILWVARNSDKALLGNLLLALQSCNMIVKLSTKCTQYERRACNYLRSLEGVEVGDAFVAKVAKRLGPVWKHMGRLLGLSVTEIEKMSHSAKAIEHETIDDITYNMLHKWKMAMGRYATYGCFVQALILVLDLDTARLNDAWRTTLHNLELLNPLNTCALY